MNEKGVAVDQLHMIHEILQTALAGFDAPLQTMLQRIAETACQIFRFNSAAVVLPNRKNFYTPRVKIGDARVDGNGHHTAEVTGDVVDRIFGRYRVKAVYYDLASQDDSVYFNPHGTERRTQIRRPPEEWNEQDVVLCRLLDSSGATAGYISFFHPADDCRISRELFYGMEIFSRCVSSALQYHARFTNLRKNERQLKQLLVSSNIFRLHLDLDGLFNEIVWAVKFSSSFNVVVLGLVNRENRSIDVRAVACTDKVKLSQMRGLQFPLASIIPLFRDEYSRGKAFFINRPEKPFTRFREIYYGSGESVGSNVDRERYKTLLIQIKSKNNNLYGLLMADDPGQLTKISDEEIQLLEIFAHNVSIAIDNRNIYVQLKKKILELEKEVAQYEPDFKDDPEQAIKTMVNRIFKDVKRY
jgi:hypothetical protein